jgi:ABC-type lipoprotein export system ATPase subunit
MIFKIKNLACKYADGPVVLRVPELDIQRGELIFIVGASGIGKSTFLEALGLMNHTIFTDPDALSDMEVTFYPQSGEPIPMSQIWQKPKDELADIRSQYFSFIFQQTNLFPHFSVGENMMMSHLITGAKQKDAEEKVREVMKELDLGHDLFHKRVVEVSGGQRQRLAFVRAFTAPFEVLFADEPTGNLDPVTSRKLMTILQEHMKNPKHPKTGVLVSHDIRLAIDFADRIIPIVNYRGSKAKHGLIDLDEVLVREGKDWVYQKSKKIVSDPVQVLWDHISKQV